VSNCIPCLSKEFKDAINKEFKNDRVAAMLDEIETCKPGHLINLCPRSSRGEKQKREPSAYQQFVGQCLREKHLHGFDPGAMKDCAGQWQEMKK